MINQITVEHFKSFDQLATIDLRDLLVIAGSNSCGKTTLIQAILLLAQTLETQRPDIVLDLGGKYVQFAEFQDAVFGRPRRADAAFTIGFNLTLQEPEPISIREVLQDRRLLSMIGRGRLFPYGLSLPRLERKSGQVNRDVDVKISFTATSTGEPTVNSILFEKFENGKPILRYTIEKQGKQYNSVMEVSKQNLNRSITLENLIEKLRELENSVGPIETKRKPDFDVDGILTVLYAPYFVGWRNPPAILSDLKRKLAQLRLPDPTEWSDTVREQFLTLIADILDFIYQEGATATVTLPPAFNHFLPHTNLYSIGRGVTVESPWFLQSFISAFGDTIKEIRRFLDTLVYLGPLRAKPERAYLATGTPLDIGIAGENAVSILWLEQNRRVFNKTQIGHAKSKQRFERAVRQWFDEFGIASTLHVTKRRRVIYQVELESGPGSDTLVTIADVGFGVSQLLPVIVAGLRAPEGSTLIFEQPEIHLHPKLQAKLADFFVCLVELGKRVIVETHSEHFINMLRLRTLQDRNGTLQKKVGIVFVRSSKKTIDAKGGSYLENLQVDEYGQIANWPPDFFPEHNKLNEEILEAMMSKYSGDQP